MKTNPKQKARDQTGLVQALQQAHYQGVPASVIEVILAWCTAIGADPFSRPIEARQALDGRSDVMRWILEPSSPSVSSPTTTSKEMS